MRALPIEAASPRAAIGSRLRAARQMRSLTILQVAESTGLTKGFLSRVERDLTSPSVSTLVAICDVVGISIGDVFSATDSQLVRADDAPRINLGGIDAVEHLLSPRHNARFQVIRSSVSPGGNGGDELYTINADAELLHVLSGAVTVFFSDGQLDLRAGDSITFDGREPHQWRSELGVELLWVLVPAAWSGAGAAR
ncbi:helix-turn-helix domain-containing protein [Microbacterium sp. zg.B48]|uniref:helix-turn-helix domain-containing protein n=1 Tax=Microbacterium sp. zg.B48 TaxID=2969408 RepID=UPI00214AA9A5|nr:helix-turn-helix domain-containing protein [Microbacterium sp. zg.B48]MCR2762485.1 helix-turn-helix domain-containing protein [Microbacterium sp. zg.B48]